MNNDYSLIILCPMAEEYAVLRGLVEDLGYTAHDVAQLAKDKKLFFCETGMGAINMLHAIYTNPQFFASATVDVLLTGFAGALSPQLHKGDACQVSHLTHFTFIDFQGAGDFELIPTPAPYHDDFLAPHDEHAPLALPHVLLSPTDVGLAQRHSLISVPALLQGSATKEYLYNKGVDMVDMEGFALASALHHMTQSYSTAHENVGMQKNIHLDIIKVITDCPEEQFDFAKLDEYKAYLRQCDPIKALLRSKFAHF